MTETLTRAKIAAIINREIGFSQEDSLSIVSDIISEIRSSLVKDNIVKISSFGTLKVCKKKARMGRNPRTSEEVLIKEHNNVSFHPSIIVKRLINSEEL